MTPQQFRQFADLLAEPALLVDSGGIILEVNLAFRSGNLQRPDGVCGRRLQELVTSDAARVDEYLRACARRRDVVIGAITFTPTPRSCRSAVTSSMSSRWRNPSAVGPRMFAVGAGVRGPGSARERFNTGIL